MGSPAGSGQETAEEQAPKPRAKRGGTAKAAQVVDIRSPRRTARRPRQLGTGTGKTTALTPEAQKTIVDAIAVGTPHEAAFEFANIGRSTGKSWLRRGRDERFRVERALLAGEMVEPAPEEEPFLAFLTAVEHAEAVSLVIAHQTNASIMRKEAATDRDRLRASHFLIAHRDPRFVERVVADVAIGRSEDFGPVERTVDEQMAYHREIIGVLVANGLTSIPENGDDDFDEG